MFVILSTHSIMANCNTCNLVFNVIIQEFNRLLSIVLVFTVVNCQLMLKCILFVYINFHVQYKFGCGR